LLTSAAVALAFLLAACQGATFANGGRPPPAPTDATISFCDDGAESCAPATSFSVNSLRDLVVSVNWENLSAGTHTQLLEISMPSGGLYQAGQTSFLVGDASQSTLTTTRTLPVAGTWISQRRI